jgi:hypothetical protein
MFGRTYLTIMLKKSRMCMRFGHVSPRATFVSRLGVTAGYCPRCGYCVRANVQPRVAREA